jgi:hypothetical protein
MYLDFADTPTSAWTNPRERLDVSDNAVVDPMDALQVINHLNATGPAQLALPDLPGRMPPPLLDVDGDGHVLPHDALFVINYLNRTNNSGEGEGDETSGGNPPAWQLPWPVIRPAVAPCEPVFSDHVNADWRELRPAIAYQFFAWSTPRVQLAEHLTARPFRASAAEQAGVADDLMVLEDSDDRLDFAALSRGRVLGADLPDQPRLPFPVVRGRSGTGG